MKSWPGFRPGVCQCQPFATNFPSWLICKYISGRLHHFTRSHSVLHAIFVHKSNGKPPRMKAMATRKTLKLIRTSFVTGQKFALHPYVWRCENANNSVGYPQFCESPRRLGLWIFNFIQILGYYAFVCVQCIRVNFSEDTSVEKKVYMDFLLVFLLFPVLFQLNILHAFDDLAVCNVILKILLWW